MKRILTIVGARPQFIKCSPVSRLLRTHFAEILVHTGQHYDYNMSSAIFNVLGIPKPDFNLGIGSGSHAYQTSRMLAEIEAVVVGTVVDLILVYGDTNSTLSGALVAAKLQIPLAHVEAGLRSYNRKMPEEINRVCTDHISDFLFCPTNVALENLRKEGITRNVFMVGDVMKDAVMQNISKVDAAAVLMKYGLSAITPFYFFTLHRQENTSDIGRLAMILDIVGQARCRTFFPVHPRTKKVLKEHRLEVPENIVMIEPVDYLESLAFQQEASLIITDSGGMQKEAYILGKPCITLRDETEWVETVEDGWNILVGASMERFLKAEVSFNRDDHKTNTRRDIFGNGDAAEKIVETLRRLL
jgi:UDP-N-acetylglucosamine 2-epimerase